MQVSFQCSSKVMFYTYKINCTDASGDLPIILSVCIITLDMYIQTLAVFAEPLDNTVYILCTHKRVLLLCNVL